MNLVAKDKDGKWTPVRSSFRKPIKSLLGNGEVAIPADSVHISTGMLDKNGRLIVVGDKVNTGEHKGMVLYDGETFPLLFFVNMISYYLTPELAATLEVIE